MISPIIRGNNPYGLVWYLLGPGRSNEHERQRMICGDSVTEFVFHDRDLTDDGMAREVASALDESWRIQGSPRVWYGPQGKDARVWHCVLSVGPHDGVLPDDQWACIAKDFMADMGFDGGDDGVQLRWIAIHHGQSIRGNDHVHIAAVLADEQGRRVSTFKDHFRASAACRRIEQRYGLYVVEGRVNGRSQAGRRSFEYGADRAPDGVREQVRLLVQSAVAVSDNEAEFVQALRDRGLWIKVRYAPGSNDKVVGYAVGLPGNDGRRVRWFAASKLSRDLALPVLRMRWNDDAFAQAKAVPLWRSPHRHDRGTNRDSGSFDHAESRRVFDAWFSRSERYGRRAMWTDVAREAAGLCAELHRTSGSSSSAWSMLATAFGALASVRGQSRGSHGHAGMRPVMTAKGIVLLGRDRRAFERYMMRRMTRLAVGAQAYCGHQQAVSLGRVFQEVVSLTHDVSVRRPDPLLGSGLVGQAERMGHER